MMKTIKETLKLALEALEKLNNTNSHWWQEVDENVIVQLSNAESALREALAQERSSDEQPAPVAKPHEQEPVAWMQNTTAGLYVIDHYDEWHCIPLYTSPPAQRKPLTDDEIESINVRLAGKRDLARLFARAIEAAHGITAAPQLKENA